MNYAWMRRLVESTLDTFYLNLQRLCVLMEAVTGFYLLTPLSATPGRAEHIYALTRHSRFGTARKVGSRLEKLAGAWGVICDVNKSHPHHFVSEAAFFQDLLNVVFLANKLDLQAIRFGILSNLLPQGFCKIGMIEDANPVLIQIARHALGMTERLQTATHHNQIIAIQDILHRLGIPFRKQRAHPSAPLRSNESSNLTTIHRNFPMPNPFQRATITMRENHPWESFAFFPFSTGFPFLASARLR